MLAALAFLGVVALLAWRAQPLLNIPGQPDGIHVWMGDFRDAIYYPVRAFLDGRNPYDAASYGAAYPVYNLFPLYSPLMLVVHAPFGLLPFEWAELAYAAATVVLLLVVVHLAHRLIGVEATTTRTLAVATLVLVSRPGYLNVLLGQNTLQVALGTYLALYATPRRPWLGAAGLALATIKPTYGIPLALLLLIRADTAIVARAVALAAVLTLPAAAVLAAHAGGVSALLATVPSNYTVTLHDDPVANAVTSAIRVDLFALLSRIGGRELGGTVEAIVGVVVIAAGGVCLWRLARLPQSRAVRNLSAALACLTLLLASYHQNYDLLLLIVPTLAVVYGAWPTAGRRNRLRRAVLTVLLVFPFANHLVAGRLLSTLQVTASPLFVPVASLNALALVAAFAICATVAWRMPPLASVSEIES